MKHLYTLLVMACLTLTTMAQAPLKQHFRMGNAATQKACALTAQLAQPIIETNIQVFPYMVAANYTKLNDATANYYLVFSSVRSQYDPNSGELSAVNGLVLYLDLYAAPNGGKSVPEGTYTKGTDHGDFTYDPEFTTLEVHGADNSVTGYIPLTSDIVVTPTSSGQYLITTKAVIGEKEKTLRFHGNFNLTNTQQTSDAYYQLTHDINTRFTGGVSLYYGNLYESNTGNMVVRLYDCAFDLESGAQLGDGYAVELMLFGPLFKEFSDAQIAPGHYTIARNFARDTWFPGMEINYMGVTVAFGTFAQELRSSDPTFGDEGYGWAYATGGTIDVVDIGEGNIRITLNLTSKTGYAIKGVYEGPQFPVFDYSPTPKSAVSTLTEDLELNLSYVKRAHIFNHGIQGDTGTRSYIVDLGSDIDPDGFVLPELNTNPYGADVMRLEFLTDSSSPYLPEGIYSVMEENYTTFYAPGRMRQGYFADGGAITGTRWMHLAPNRYYVMDGHAPAAAGSVSVIRGGKNEAGEDIYTFLINIIDDADFNITGTWQGPVHLRYDPKEIDPNCEGVASITAPTRTEGLLYDLQGRCLQGNVKVGSAVQSGLYITNNRKFLQR